MRPATLAAAVLLFVGCGSDRICFHGSCGKEAEVCARYIACFEATGGSKGSLDSSFGSQGSCWNGGNELADVCSQSCSSALASLKAQFPAAGCK